MILFLTIFKFCLVFYGIYLKNNWKSFCVCVGFHISARFVICRRFREGWRSRELRRARLRLLRTRQACFEHLIWQVFCMFTWEFVRGIWVSVKTSLLVRQRPGCPKVAITSVERWPNHVVTWRAARWYCCSMPALRHPTFSDVNVVGATLSSFFRMFQSCDDLWWEMA